MQYSNFSRSSENNVITLYNEVPIENVGKVTYFTDNASGIFLKKEFRWSFNKEYWSAWETLTQSGIAAINTHNNYYLFLELRYVLSSTNSGNVTLFTLNYNKGNNTATTPRILTEDIQHRDSSAVLIHDIIQSYVVTQITDASTLGKHPPSYFLDRSHHTGTQPISSVTNLEARLNRLDSAAGVTFEYVDGSLAEITKNYGRIEEFYPHAVVFFGDDSSTITGSERMTYDPDTSTLILGICEDQDEKISSKFIIEDYIGKQTIILCEASINDYTEINIINNNNGDTVSSDIVATANNGTSDIGYIDMGINGENYNQNIVGRANDAYLYSDANNLLIGNIKSGQGDLIFFTGGEDSYNQARMIIQADGKILIGNHIPLNDTIEMHGSVRVIDNLIIDSSLTLYGNSEFGTDSSSLHHFIGDVNIDGNLTATTKSFLINHPTHPGHKLQYGNLEGPEHGVYIRGLYDSNIINLPYYWKDLVDENTITVNLTSTQKWNVPYVKDIQNNSIYIGKLGFGKLCGFYTIYAERKDISKLIVEK